ncbi:MAG: hypothetical protein K6F86_13120 [Lachnospiraceae bacterium]|nr:hypothetical protein [Lachnospiraceae bacterium]
MGAKKKLEQNLAVERTELSHERTELSVLRTELAFRNSKLSVEQTHLSFVRTEVSLAGSAAAVYKALPALGVSGTFSVMLAVFLLVWAVYFFVRDRLTYPKLKREIEEMERQKDEIIKQTGMESEGD